MAAAEELRAVLEALGRYDVDEVMSHWAEESWYDNPMVGPPAEGKETVRAAIQQLADNLQANGETVVIDRMSAGEDYAVGEWHLEPDTGKKGVHVAELNDEGLIRHVTVYPRA